MMQVIHHSVQVHISEKAFSALTGIERDLSRCTIGKTTLVAGQTFATEIGKAINTAVRRDYRLLTMDYRSDAMDGGNEAVSAGRQAKFAAGRLVLGGAMVAVAYHAALCTASLVCGLVIFSGAITSSLKVAVCAMAVHDLFVMLKNAERSNEYLESLKEVYDENRFAPLVLTIAPAFGRQYSIHPSGRWLSFGAWCIIQNTFLQRALERVPLRKGVPT